MAKCVVLWTSEMHAIIVSTDDGVEEILHVESEASGRLGGRPGRPLNEHYRKIIDAILDARSIFIFGPAQAKTELKREMLKTETLPQRVVGTELADTMTEDELVARARQICGPPAA